LKEAGLELHTLATWPDVLRGAASEHLSTEDRAAIEHFLTDPVSWSTHHGGRAARSLRD
jgi:orotate phosphoribosyltransferase